MLGSAKSLAYRDPSFFLLFFLLFFPLTLPLYRLHSAAPLLLSVRSVKLSAPLQWLLSFCGVTSFLHTVYCGKESCGRDSDRVGGRGRWGRRERVEEKRGSVI